MKPMEIRLRERRPSAYVESEEVYTPESIRETWEGCTAKNTLVIALLEKWEAERTARQQAEEARDEAQSDLAAMLEHHEAVDASNLALRTRLAALRLALRRHVDGCVKCSDCAALEMLITPDPATTSEPPA